MARVARFESPIIIPIQEVEPISLNAARRIGAVLAREHVKTVMVLTVIAKPAVVSRIPRRSGRAGINVSCVPVFGEKTLENWSSTWHGIQEVAEQFLELQYYRLYVLPAYASGWL